MVVSLEAEEQNKGHASSLMKIVQFVHEATGISVCLGAHPYGNRPLDLPRLVLFYRKYGFKVERVTKYGTANMRLSKPLMLEYKP